MVLVYGGGPADARIHATEAVAPCGGGRRSGSADEGAGRCEPRSVLPELRGLPDIDGPRDRARGPARRRCVPRRLAHDHRSTAHALSGRARRCARAFPDACRGRRPTPANEHGRCTPYFHLALVEFAAGNWPLALRYAEEAYEILFQAERTGELGSKLFARALIEAHLGGSDEARGGTGRESTSAGHPARGSPARLLGVLGFVELSVGDLPAAADRFARATADWSRCTSGSPDSSASTLTTSRRSLASASLRRPSV